MQTFTGNAGDILTFNFDYLTNEAVGPGTIYDYAFLVIDGKATLLADSHTPGFISGAGGFNSQTGYHLFTTASLGSTGTHTIGFGVVHTRDTSVESGLLIDNLGITPNAPAAVPEPSSLTLLGMATASFAGYFGWRRRKQPVAA